MGEYISFCSGVLCVVFRASALVDILHFPVDLAAVSYTHLTLPTIA